MSETTDSATNSVEPLYQVKLLSALRSGDAAAIHPFLTEISKDKRKESSDSNIDTGAAALHLAVRCASPQTVSLLLSHRAISPNGIHPPGSGTTALHLAASLGRIEIVNLLLEQDDIDDSLRDNSGKTCREVARNKDVIRAIDDSRSFLNASYRSLLHSYILSPPTDPPSPALLQLLDSPRNKFVDLSYLDNDSGTSLLHEAAKRKDLRLIELAVRAGADVFLRNRRGKMAHEASGKDDRVKVFLRQFANHDKTLIPNPAPLTEPPALKGYLNKYTNVAKGYNTRWFVLKNGILSYYRHQEDETIASRGSISMKSAIVKVSERTRFEVSTTTSRGQHHHSGAQKWYLKANHPVEAHRWTQALQKSIEWFKQDAAVSTDGERRRQSIESDSSGMRSNPSLQSHHLPVPMKRSDVRRKTLDSVSLSGSTGDASPNLTQNEDMGGINNYSMADQADDEDNEEDSSSSSTGSQSPPHENFELQGNATVAQMEMTLQLLDKLLLSTSDGSQQWAETQKGIKQSVATVQEMFNEYSQMARERDEWWKKQLKKERQRQLFWEESLATVVKEGENLERELRVRSRKRGSKVFAPSASGTLDSAWRTLKSQRRPSVLNMVRPMTRAAEETPPVSPLPRSISYEERPQLTPQQLSTSSPPPPVITPYFPGDFKLPVRSPTADTLVPEILSPPTAAPNLSQGKVEEDRYDTDEEDEFFDAIETNNIPNLLVPQSLTSPSISEVVLPKYVNVEPYAGYVHLRNRLNLRSDERPSTSLWSVLKHSIGKDLTKISFPVFFNEPTSMLQRMAEDMEFSECLDTAAAERDPLRRIAFVAAFAMSNYSSTLGRIAKPFNPMLSETFEYVRLDKKFRYVSEQVSHHPPISACWAESPAWHYYGEVDAQNKFMGKSFEIRPTGVAHADLLLPEAMAPHYPKARGESGKGKVTEHYSWKKVTTNISGFILGSPTIDHYGDMVITNHRTGDQCVLTFKPRGWRGKDAYEISGQVINAKGQVAYDIAGRWNSQLIAKQSGVGNGQLHPDLTISGPTSPSATPEYFLLWRNSEKSPGSPFNLTPFAITLNDCPLDTLRPFICPTDCRLRPDQRAFELGKYEMANDLKQEQEEKQRAMRKAREEGSLPPHEPRWFRAETDGDTGERVWTPNRTENQSVEYWAEREKMWSKGGNLPWEGVDDIFIEQPKVIVKEMEKLQAQ